MFEDRNKLEIQETQETQETQEVQEKFTEQSEKREPPKAVISKSSKNSRKSNLFKDKSKASTLIIAIVVALSVVVIVALVTTDKITDGNYKTEYITAESDISMPTAEEGKTEATSDRYGNSFIIREDGVYKKSDFNDGYEKMMHQKIVPLVGTWKSDNSAVIYKFNEDETFCISVPYETESGDIAYLEYSGKVNVRKNYKQSLSKFGFSDMNAMFNFMGIDSNSFVQENLYYIALDYNKLVNSATGEEIPLNSETTGMEDEFEGSRFDGLIYTYWLEDTNDYKMKVCSLSDKITYTYVRQPMQ